MSFASDLLKRAAVMEVNQQVKPERQKKVRIVRNRRGRVKLWSPEDNAKLELLAETLPGPEIAERMGRTYQSIKNQAHRRGIKLIAKRCRYASWTKAMFCKIEGMHKAGYNGPQIADALHLTQNQVRGAIGRLGLAGSRNHQWRLVEDWAIAVYYRKSTGALLAKVIGVTEMKCKSRYVKLLNSSSVHHLRDVVVSKDIVKDYCLKNSIETPQPSKGKK